MQEVHTAFGLVRHSVTLSNSPGTDGRSIAILNQVDITSESNKVMNECEFLTVLALHDSCQVYFRFIFNCQLKFDTCTAHL
jgi:hypothetical protein